MNDWEEKTLRAFARLMFELFGDSLTLIMQAPADLTTEELQVIDETEALVLSWEMEDEA